MRDVKELGVIGQQYEERTTGKVGTLESRDSKCKTLMMVDSNGKCFSVSYSSFRSKWRKVKIEDVEVVVEEPEVEAIEISDDVEVIEKFNAENNGVKISEIAKNVYSFVKDDFEIMRIKRAKNKFVVACLPDIYTESVADIRPFVQGFTGVLEQTGLGARFTLNLSWYDMLKKMHDAIVNVNLYGYITE